MGLIQKSKPTSLLQISRVRVRLPHQTHVRILEPALVEIPNSGVRIIGGPLVVYKIILFCSGGSLPTAARFRIFKTSYIRAKSL